MLKIYRKIAFTLAEVLITLGIIGVVAALTIPTLIQNHKKTTVVTKLQKASSVLLQAYLYAKADYGTTRDAINPLDAESSYENLMKYYAPYIKFIKTEKYTKSAVGYLADGTGLMLIKRSNCGGSAESWSCTYIYACLNEKACITTDKSNNTVPNGKDVFGFYISGKVGTVQFDYYTREIRLRDCKNGSPEACTGLIYEAGWKIPDDYPVKL